MFLGRLPNSLLLVVLQSLNVLGQRLTLNQALSISTNDLPDPPTFAIPQSSASLTVAIALCSPPQSDGARFFISTNPRILQPGPEGGTGVNGVNELTLGSDGTGSFQLNSLSAGGVLAIQPGSVQQTFQVSLIEATPSTQYDNLPLLGDTTSNEAILFSPPFLSVPQDPPQFPNYTLPPANISYPSLPPSSSTPNYTLIVGPTDQFSSLSGTGPTSLASFACAWQQNNTLADLVRVQNSTLVYRDSAGWRAQWLVEGLQGRSNYTVYYAQDGTIVGGPINFFTKSASFPCPLVHSLPYCPKVSYAVPLPFPDAPATTYDATNIFPNISTPLLTYLTNFTTTLLTFACGRDWYSPVQSCASCQEAYRTWLCSITFPRCGEEPSSLQSASSTIAALGGESTAQAVFPALTSPVSGPNSRNPNLPPSDSPYQILLPCLETCNAADRACPNFLGFTCPLPRFNANVSYGVGYIDGDAHSGGWEAQGGLTGIAQDRFGNIWCNG